VLQTYCDRTLGEEGELAMEEFWEYIPNEWEMEEDHALMSDDVFNGWFWFDRRLPGGETVVERCLSGESMGRGERQYLQQMAQTTMELYEVIEAVPGRSITCGKVLGEGRVTVRERSASRVVKRGDLLAARISPWGPSGGPELDGGLMPLPMMARRGVVEQLTAAYDAIRRENPRADGRRLHEDIAPFLHQAWMSFIFAPPIPEVVNQDGEVVLPTSVRFDVVGAEVELSELLTGCSELVATGPGAWSWRTREGRGGEREHGQIELSGGQLRLETMTAERGAKGRVLLERVAAGALRHKVTTHESLQAMLREGRKRPGAAALDASTRLEPDVEEQIVLDWQQRHYRGWIDEPIPALNNATPRDAARDPSTRPQVEALVRGLEGLYEDALRRAAPAYDPSWMWHELNLVDDAEAATPPPLATERWAEAFEGWEEACRGIAEAARRRPGFEEATTIFGDEELGRELAARRLLGELSGTHRAEELAVALRCVVNHDLHLRKTFWVSESLAWMLSKTEADVAGRELRLPFASFALVFTDRHTLSQGERLLASRGGPMAGHILRVVTVFVRGRADAGEGDAVERRRIELDFAFDTLGEGVPEVVSHTLVVEDDAVIVIDPEAPIALEMEGEQVTLARVRPLPALLRVVTNAVLYATSAGVEPERRPTSRASRGGSAPGDAALELAEEVYFLPGRITISVARQYQAVERGREGGQLMHRFMVRGHWRRANATWQDQRVRWIEPYWKGPDLATILERQYQLTGE